MQDQDHLLGALRYNNVIFSINIFFLIIFLVSWFKSYKRSGFMIDPWHFFLLLSYFMPFLLMYPFAGADANILYVGDNIYSIQPYIQQAYFISLTGYIFFFIGGKVFSFYKKRNVIYVFFIKPLRSTLGYLFVKIVSNRMICNILFYGYVACLILVLYLAYKGGSFNDPRAYFYFNDDLRVIYNSTNSLSAIVSLLLTARMFQYNALTDKVYFGFFVVLTFFIGARAAALGPVITAFMYFIYFNWHGKIKIIPTAIFASIFISLFAIVTFFRSGTESSGNILIETFYGNSFSDLRDFAWVLSAWNGKYFFGKTYLSAFMSFIPTTFSSFRTEYNIGRITAILGGFSPSEHPGLRPGLFGESYINFGIIGVAFIGTVLGYTIRFIDYTVKKYSASINKLEVFAVVISALFVINLTVTAGFFAIYVYFFAFVFLFITKLLLQSLFKH